MGRGIVNPQQPPAPAAYVPAQVKGEGPRRTSCVPDLDAPDFVVNQPRSAAQRRPLFLCPPLAPLEPADRFGADFIVLPRPDKGLGLALRGAGDVHRLAEHPHNASRKVLTPGENPRR